MDVAPQVVIACRHIGNLRQSMTVCINMNEDKFRAAPELGSGQFQADFF